jgi:PTS system N-acetylgalactosamine-specific IID component
LTTPLKWEREVVVRGETVMQTISVQEQLDKVLPYMLPVGLTLLVYWLLKRRGWTPMRAIMLLIVIGFLGGALGIFG